MLSSLSAGLLAVIVIYGTLFVGDTPAEASGVGQATLQGVTVSIVSIDASSSGTAINIRVQGRDELGEILSSTSRPILLEENGARHNATRATTDSDAPREQTIFFEALPSNASVSLVLGDLVFETAGERAARVDRARAGEPSNSEYGRTVSGKWSISTTVIRQANVARESEMHVAAGYGPGTIVVDHVVITHDETTITGHVVGFLPGQFEDIEIAPAAMTVDQRSAQFLGGRSGYGPGNASFELRFASIAGTAAKLIVPFNVAGVNTSNSAHDPAALANLARYAGSASTVEFVLP
jgi:hypothetical protein